MHILVTGSNGFVGKNLIQKFRELDNITLSTFDRSGTLLELEQVIKDIDIIVHLAGVNRPQSVDEFEAGNLQLTRNITEIVERSSKNIPIVFSSSIHAEASNPYGKSKKAAEDCLLEFSEKTGNKVHILRIPNIFGKWCKPNYNSVIATFCHNIINDIPIKIDDEKKVIPLVYIDDVVDKIVSIILSDDDLEIKPVYKVSLGEISSILKAFKEGRETLSIEKVGTGFERALYSTYISYYQPNQFSYKLESHIDERGIFAEFLKTHESGQVSFFTAHPDVTRGGHYHHTKNEKFLVISGNARFNFRNIDTDQKFSKEVSSKCLEVVETIPGWVHDITNIGESELVVMLWANELFDPDNPDTFWGEV